MKFVAVFAAIVAVAAAAPTTVWTLADLSSALQNPSTPASALPFLEHALNTMMQALFNGQQVDSIAIPTPGGGLLAIEDLSPAIVMPVEMDLTPVAPAPVPAPVAPAPAVIADAAGSPLVQIIVNVKTLESGAAAVPTPVPGAIVPSPAPGAIVPEAVYEPQPLPTPEAVYEPQPLPTPVVVVDQPSPVVIAPAPVVVAPELPAPIVIAPAPAPVVIAPENPIDVIAVAAPDSNPMDLLAPTPITVGGHVVGPMI